MEKIGISFIYFVVRVIFLITWPLFHICYELIVNDRKISPCLVFGLTGLALESVIVGSIYMAGFLGNNGQIFLLAIYMTGWAVSLNWSPKGGA